MAKNNNLIKLGDAISQLFKEEKLDEKYSIFHLLHSYLKKRQREKQIKIKYIYLFYFDATKISSVLLFGRCK